MCLIFNFTWGKKTHRKSLQVQRVPGPVHPALNSKQSSVYGETTVKPDH